MVTDNQRLEEGQFAENDLVLMATPDNRVHFGKVMQVLQENESGTHLLICHHACNDDREQWTLEHEAMGG